MKIRFHYPKGIEGWQREVQMGQVPRIGETVNFAATEYEDDMHYQVLHVTHYPNDPDFEVYITVR
jgi:hypothetical protein